ncbi:membrane-associated protein, putative [Bodo saltans]|uniref:Membrane-associated protein, putative n=1 Tax=Bodo saltans TaxID=75058 RepID=A0A0S4JMC8_BODSA|nr:membrane-associated protein, putative [Bodo saltans]|eukprot:CUG92665.1 membrane-associated protein, putative [Bodo saltans]
MIRGVASAPHKMLLRRNSAPLIRSSLAATLVVQGRHSSSTSTGFVGMLDNWWFGGAATSAAPVASSTSAQNYVAWFDDAFETVQGALGVEAWMLLMMFGGAVRLCTLYFSLYGERAAVRMQCALPSLVPAHNQFQRIYYNENSSSLEVQQAATVLKALRKQTYKAHNTSNMRTLAGLIASPIVLQGFYSVSKMCESFDSDVGTSSFMWCAALGMPDPLMILPVVSCGLTLLNLELTLLSRGDLKKGIMGNLIWAGRMLCVCAIPAAAQFRSGVLLYWIGMSTVGLLQPLLVRSTSFRRWFGIPDQPPAAPTAAPTEADLFQTRLILQAPYFSHLFETDIGNGASSAVPQNKTRGGLPESPAPSYSPRRKDTTAPPTSMKSSGGRRLSEEMSSVESQSFHNDTPVSNKKDGAAFASSGWRSTAREPLSTDDLLPSNFRGKGGQ